MYIKRKPSDGSFIPINKHDKARYNYRLIMKKESFYSLWPTTNVWNIL